MFLHSLLPPRSLVASKTPQQLRTPVSAKEGGTAQWRMQMQELSGQKEIGLSKLTGRREGPELCTGVNHHYNTAMEKTNYRQYQRSCV